MDTITQVPGIRTRIYLLGATIQPTVAGDAGYAPLQGGGAEQAEEDAKTSAHGLPASGLCL